MDQTMKEDNVRIIAIFALYVNGASYHKIIKKLRMGLLGGILSYERSQTCPNLKQPLYFVDINHFVTGK